MKLVIRTLSLAVAGQLALAGCGPLDPDAPASINLNFSVERPCAAFCSRGTEHELRLVVFDGSAADTGPVDGVVLRLRPSSNAISIADTVLRTDAGGSVRTVVTLLEAAEEAAILVSLVERPASALEEEEWQTGIPIGYRILSEPPQVTFGQDSLDLGEPGCAAPLRWSVTVAGEPIEVEERPYITIGNVRVAKFPYSNDYSQIRAVAEGNTHLQVAYRDLHEYTLRGTLPIRVGPFVPRKFITQPHWAFLGDTVGVGGWIEGACQARSVGDELTVVNLSPNVLWFDPSGSRVVAHQLGTGRYLSEYREFSDTVSLTVVDYRVLPVDTVLRVGQTLEFRPQGAAGDSVYHDWEPSWNDRLSYASSDTAVATVSARNAFYGQVVARAPGTAMITVRWEDRHGRPVGPPRSATVTVVEAD